MQREISKFEKCQQQAKRARLEHEVKMDVEGDESKAWLQLHELAGQWANREFSDRAVVVEKHKAMLLEKQIEDQAKADKSMDIEEDFLF